MTGELIALLDGRQVGRVYNNARDKGIIDCLAAQLIERTDECRRI